MPVFPGYPRPALVPWTTHEAHGYAAEAAFMITHSGTHVDAPWHFAKRGKRMHEVPVSQLVCEARVYDCRRAGPLGRIGMRMLREADRRFSDPPARGSAALVLTGWSRTWGKKQYLTSHPGLTKEGARYLLSRGHRAVGVDSPNLDHPRDASFPAHHAILGSGAVIIENLTNLRTLTRQGKERITLVALPLKLWDASGSPVRAVAIVQP